VLDTTPGNPVPLPFDVYRWEHRPELAGRTIGFLRNQANALVGDAEIIAHVDSDDQSHPRRIEEQVALLQASGTDTVGYRECLFWREPWTEYRDVSGHQPVVAHIAVRHPGEAWLYTNTSRAYAIGASLLYWRKAWVAHPFPDAPKNSQASGEDTLWLREVTCKGVTAARDFHGPFTNDSLMICRIHPGNTMNYDLQPNNWRRVVEWDGYCRERMAL
jgi:hypothetical protein